MSASIKQRHAMPRHGSQRTELASARHMPIMPRKRSTTRRNMHIITTVQRYMVVEACRARHEGYVSPCGTWCVRESLSLAQKENRGASQALRCRLRQVHETEAPTCAPTCAPLV